MAGAEGTAMAVRPPGAVPLRRLPRLPADGDLHGLRCTGGAPTSVGDDDVEARATDAAVVHERDLAALKVCLSERGHSLVRGARQDHVAVVHIRECELQ